MKKIIKFFLINITYFFYSNINFYKPKVKSIDETLDELINKEKSIIRFGDGEVTLIKGDDLKLQKSNPRIVAKMKQLLKYKDNNLMIGLPDIFSNLDKYHKKSRMHWMDHLFFCRKYYHQYCNKDRLYANSFITRPYYQFSDKSLSTEWFSKAKRIWEKKDIIIVEGLSTHNGVGNDLFNTAASISRIICPSKNAIDVYDKIFTACKTYPKDRLFIISLGVTAKFLVEDLYKEGYRALDMGNIDTEYEWFLLKSEEKIPLPKHQIHDIEANRAAGYLKYLSEIEKWIEID